MEPGTLVIVHLSNPKEKYWGRLEALGPAGLTLRGIEVALFDEWAREHLPGGGSERELGLVRIFFPLHRVEKVFEDERVGSVLAYHERFRAMVGTDVREAL